MKWDIDPEVAGKMFSDIQPTVRRKRNPETVLKESICDNGFSVIGTLRTT
jgi:hypothetical protein